MGQVGQRATDEPGDELAPERVEEPTPELTAVGGGVEVRTGRQVGLDRVESGVLDEVREALVECVRL